MSARHFIIAALWIASFASCAAAAGTVQLELVGDRAAAAAFQEWSKALGKGGIADVRIRSGSEDELKPSLENTGTPERSAYRVTGVVLSREELLLPGGRYQRGDIGRLKLWLDDLGQNGPANQRPAKVAFGLTQPQFEATYKALSKPLATTTRGVARSEAFEKIIKPLAIPVVFSGGSASDLGSDKVEDELNDLTAGAALAALLRPAGYCLVPRVLGGQLEISVVKSRPDLNEIWPIGAPPEKTAQELLPSLMEFLNVNVQNVSAATAAEAIAKRLKAPAIYDRVGLARHGIDPDKKMVSLPNARTTHSLALKKILYQAGLKYEIRVDEGGTPFIWISTIKPL
jgi:hypothetical protein